MAAAHLKAVLLWRLRLSGIALALDPRTTEFLWKSLLPRLPKSKCGNTSVKTGLVVLGGARLPDDVANVLQKGPKFSLEPKIPAHELLTLNRRIADKVEDEGRERCLLEGVDSLRRAVSKGSTAPAGSTQGVVKYFQNNDLVLLQADKDGGFVVLPSGAYCEKALQAVKKNFSPRKAVPSKGTAFLSLEGEPLGTEDNRQRVKSYPSQLLFLIAGSFWWNVTPGTAATGECS
ncbi:hypothetical protein HPB48_017457 [Haemaphysalis longicornis]|uniref:Uncharacterized protein n=1 Tax=Haemaphysalis longicornis TaxID=44386 RepID=A0A9J6FJY9_HAELO|nr:hypothetical protein HPB48_017457 [Haemaphysalis longicornis]